MSEEATTTTVMQEQPRRSSGGRIALFAGGSVAALVAAGFLAIGGAGVWADHHRDDHGFYTTGSHRFSTEMAALASENLNLDGVDVLADAGGDSKLRLKVDSTSGKPVFVGVARTRDVSKYLGGVAHTTVTNVDDGPLQHFSVDYREHGGARQAGRPAKQHIWAASARGTGTQTVTWDARDGDWSIVVMNADGSPGVHAAISAGTKLTFLSALAWTTLIAGILFVIATGVLMLFASRPVAPQRRGQSPLVGA
jgi:hypothetical protein